MTGDRAGGNNIPGRLRESLQQLRVDIDRVEIWAGALEGFAQPVPDYDPSPAHILPAEEPNENQ
jgi:hypothetical protein